MRCSCKVLAGMAAVGLAACTGLGGTGSQGSAHPGLPAPVYAHRMSTSDVVLYWNCARPEPGVLRLEGMAQNPWQAQPIVSLRFELVGLAAQGRRVSEARADAGDSQIGTNQSTPFHLDHRLGGGEVRFDLYIQYYFSQMEMDARLAGPPVPLPWLLADTTRFLIQDACSESRHLAR